MKLSFKNLLKFRNIIWILLMLLVIIIVYTIFIYLNVFEGAYDINNNVTSVVISPLEGTWSDWLNIAKIKLTDINGNNMNYTAKSSNGRWPWIYYGYWLDIDRLYDNTDSPYSMFHSGQTGCTLTLNITDTNQTLSKVTIRNRRDCCQDRFKAYKMSFKNISGVDVIPPIKLDRPNLLGGSYQDDIYIPVEKPGPAGAQGVTGAQGPQGPTGAPGKTEPVDNSNQQRIQQ